MASFTVSSARLAAPSKVSGLGFRRAVSAVRVPAKAAPVAAKSVATTVVAGKPGAKVKTNKSAAKRFKITASGKVRSGNTHIRGSRRARARLPDARG